jgi:hypothetical protein
MYTILEHNLRLNRYCLTHFLHQNSVTSQKIIKYSVLSRLNAFFCQQIHLLKDTIRLNEAEVTLVEVRSTTASKGLYTVFWIHLRLHYLKSTLC